MISCAKLRRLTDLYLPALCVTKGSGFATLDSRIDPSQVLGGSRSLILIPAEEDQ